MPAAIPPPSRQSPPMSPNTLRYDAEQDVVSLESQHHAASGEPFEIERETFITLWQQLQRGDVLSGDTENEYTSLPALLDGQYRTSGVMGLLATVFDDIAADTRPVRVWLVEESDG